MSEKVEVKSEEVPTQEEEGAGFQRYEFIADNDQMLRCYVFEIVTTCCEGLFDVAELNLVYKWIREGHQEKPRSLRAV